MTKQFQFRKFKPSAPVSIYAHTLLLQIADYVEDGFPTLATITKVQEQYFCYLELYTKNGLLTAESVSSDPIVAIDQLDTKIRDQISAGSQMEGEPGFDFWRLRTGQPVHSPSHGKVS